MTGIQLSIIGQRYAKPVIIDLYPILTDRDFAWNVERQTEDNIKLSLKETGVIQN